VPRSERHSPLDRAEEDRTSSCVPVPDHFFAEAAREHRGCHTPVTWLLTTQVPSPWCGSRRRTTSSPASLDWDLARMGILECAHAADLFFHQFGGCSSNRCCSAARFGRATPSPGAVLRRAIQRSSAARSSRVTTSSANERPRLRRRGLGMRGSHVMTLTRSYGIGH
jgi:hypothetical protein